uniref:FTP domain-containing protein n=1 Tax=Macrostomum lignano TaxID=282301 RepID=A0A1I8GQN0_9PLAT
LLWRRKQTGGKMRNGGKMLIRSPASSFPDFAWMQEDLIAFAAIDCQIRRLMAAPPCMEVTLLFAVLCVAVCSADLQVQQLPKNMQAKLSTKWTPSENANLGNNGITSGTYYSGSQCVHAAWNDTLPWWMLDMQTVRLLSSVRIWNRLDCCSGKFSNVTFGVSAFESMWSSFNSSLIDECYRYTGVPAHTENPLSFTCSRPVAGRYLTLERTPASPVYFHFCEIDVYVFTKSAPHRFLDAQPIFSTAAAAPLMEIPSIRSLIECSLRCGEHPTCLYAMHFRTGSCRFFLSPTVPLSLRDGFIAESGSFVGLVG